LSSIAPGVPGLDGIIIQSTSGLTPPFKHVDLQAARQDGVTNNGTVYDPAVITLQGEIHAATAHGLDVVRDAWMGALNPRKTQVLEYITLDGGYWRADVRLESTWTDVIKYDRRYLWRPLVTKIRIDNAFWFGPPSTDTFRASFTTFGDTFISDATGALSTDWTVFYSSGHTGTITVDKGVGAVWTDTGNSNQTAIALFNTDTDTDFQIISIQLGGAFEGINFGGEAATDIWGRLDDAGNGVRCHIQDTAVTVSRFNSGTETPMFSTQLVLPPLPGEIWTFYVGFVLGSPRTYSVTRSGFDLFGFNFDGHTLFSFSEFGTGSVVGENNRGIGFGMDTAAGETVLGVAEAESVSAPVAAIAAADNGNITQSGFVQLSNIGTEEGWPQYVCTGPGTFGFGDGPSSATTITLGPLAVGQTAVITTLPRLRSVVDAANPANNLYPLLNGRFSNSIPGVPLPSDAVPVQIPVSVTNGSAASTIVATLTPRRIHPV
jgi:hypothetical protein